MNLCVVWFWVMKGFEHGFFYTNYTKKRLFPWPWAKIQHGMFPVVTYIKTVFGAVLFQPSVQRLAVPWTQQPANVTCPAETPIIIVAVLFQPAAQSCTVLWALWPPIVRGLHYNCCQFCFSYLHNTGPFPEHCDQPVWEIYITIVVSFVSAIFTTPDCFLSTATNQFERSTQ